MQSIDDGRDYISLQSGSHVRFWTGLTDNSGNERQNLGFIVRLLNEGNESLCDVCYLYAEPLSRKVKGDIERMPTSRIRSSSVVFPEDGTYVYKVLERELAKDEKAFNISD